MRDSKKGYEMRIVIWAPVLYPWMIKLRDALNERGCKAIILSKGIPKNYHLWRKYETCVITIPKNQLFKFLYPIMYLLRYHPNLLILFATETFTSMGLSVLSKILRIPVIPIVEDNIERRYDTPIRKVAGKLKRLFVKCIYTNARVIVAESRASFDYLIRMGCSNKRIHVIPHGTDIEQFKPVGINSDFLIKYKIPENSTEKIKVLYLGGLNYYKGIKYLIEAIQTSSNNEIVFLIPVFGASVLKYKTILERRKNVYLLPPIEYEDMVKLYSFVDIVIVPSVLNEREGSERSPNVVIEALACGKVVIGTNVGGIPTYVGDAGLIIPERDPKAIIDAISKLSLDNKLMISLKIKARRRAEEVFDIKKYGDKLMMLYEQFFQKGWRG